MLAQRTASPFNNPKQKKLPMKLITLSTAETVRGKVKAKKLLAQSNNERSIMRKAYNAKCETVISTSR